MTGQRAYMLERPGGETSRAGRTMAGVMVVGCPTIYALAAQIPLDGSGVLAIDPARMQASAVAQVAQLQRAAGVTVALVPGAVATSAAVTALRARAWRDVFSPNNPIADQFAVVRQAAGEAARWPEELPPAVALRTDTSVGESQTSVSDPSGGVNSSSNEPLLTPDELQALLGPITPPKPRSGARRAPAPDGGGR
jgi:hypothetical protein